MSSTIPPYVTSSDRSVQPGFALNAMDWLALMLAIIGGINWGLIGAFNFNLVTAIFGDNTTVTRIVYIVVGLAALYCLSLPARFPRSAA